jgi:hypothetical protein
VGCRRLIAAAVLASVLLGCSHSSKSGQGTSVFKIKVGQCVVPPTAIKAEITSVQVVACSLPHTQEVFADVTYSAIANATTTSTDAFPGTAMLRTYADGACLQRFAGYVGVDYRDSTLFYTYMLPSARSWTSHDRTIVCLITTTGQKLTLSVKGSRL